MKQYTVIGMSCAACSARIEKAVNKIDGITECNVSLLTNSMSVAGNVPDQVIIQAVRDAGYDVFEENADPTEKIAEEDSTLKKRLWSSVLFLLVLMYLSMGHMMWNWPVPDWLMNNHIAMGLLQMLLTIIIMVINQKFFISGYKSLVKRTPNMDTLVALGATAAFGYSTVILFAMTDAQLVGDTAKVMEYMHDFYFESAAMILTLITVGKMLEAHSKGKTTNAIKGLMGMAPKSAYVLREGEEVLVPVDAIRIGMEYVVRPGEQIPVDGIVKKGNSAVDESALTGESIPVDKGPGMEVSAGTMNLSGYMVCEATRVGQDTALSQIIQMVSDAAATKAPIAKIADKVSGIFVPTVIIIAVVTTLVWLITGATIGYALARGISVLVISCPCALGLATPVAIMVGNGVGAKNGIMFKTAAALEETGKADIVCLDKTGTITTGNPRVTDVVVAKGVTEAQLMVLANALEQKSEHPLAKAITAYAKEHNIHSEEVNDFEIFPGNGLRGRMEGDTRMGYAGNAEFIQKYTLIPEEWKKKSDALAINGKTPLYFAYGEKLLGIVAVADVIKPDSRQAIQELKDMGIRVVMLTGDNPQTANAIGGQVGVDEVIANVRPEGKEQVVREWKKQGKVVMVGDGINDAPALTCADMGIAIGAGTDIAVDSAEVVLMKSRLSDVPAAIRLSRYTLKNIRENLFWAFLYNVIGIPIAAGVWIPLFHLELSPMFAAAAMSLSSFCVVTNALRLNRKKIYREGSSSLENNPALEVKKENIERKEDKKMTKTMTIEGMMCGHCEARVKKCLESLPQVEKAEVSHETKTAVVTLTEEVSNELLRQTVEAQDYQVSAIE